MKKLLVLIAFAAALTSAQAATSYGVYLSPHDFSKATWNSRAGLCSTCHTAHNTNPDYSAPLWAHKSTTTVFNPYTSPTMDAPDKGSLPSAASKACLSCHDGSLAVNTDVSGAVTGTTGAQFATGIISSDLHLTHPISITYDPVADTGLFPVDTLIPWTSAAAGNLAGKPLGKSLLLGGKVECASCHDVHKMDGYAPFSGIMTRIGGTDANGVGSTLCRTCHNK